MTGWSFCAGFSVGIWSKQDSQTQAQDVVEFRRELLQEGFTEPLVAKLHHGSARFVHLLGGVGVEINHFQRAANPLGCDILQLRPDH